MLRQAQGDMKRIFFPNSVLIAGGTMALWALWRHLSPPSVVGEPQLASSVAWDGRTLVFAGLAAFFISALAWRPRPRMVVAWVSFSLMAVLFAVELVLATTALGPSANVPFWLIEHSSPETKKQMAVAAAQSGVTID